MCDHSDIEYDKEASRNGSLLTRHRTNGLTD